MEILDYERFRRHLAGYSLDVELVLPDGDAVDELEGGPQAVELGALVDVDHPVLRGFPVPNGVVEESLDAGEDRREDGEAAAEALPRQEIPFAGDLRLLRVADLVDVLHDLQRCVLRLEAFLLRVRLLAL